MSLYPEMISGKSPGCRYTLISALITILVFVILLSICSLTAFISDNVLHLGNPPPIRTATPSAANLTVTPTPIQQPTVTPGTTQENSFATWISETWASVTSSETIQYWGSIASIIGAVATIITGILWFKKKLKRSKPLDP